MRLVDQSLDVDRLRIGRIPAISSPPDGLFAFALQVSTLSSNGVTSSSAKTLKRRGTASPLRVLQRGAAEVICGSFHVATGEGHISKHRDGESATILG